MRDGAIRLLVLLAAGAACLACLALPSAARAGSGTPTWQLGSYLTRGWDRSFKCDLYEEMPDVPRVLVYGGSRALRMDPATIKRLTSLTAFNFALHNGRPEDAWAVTDWVLDTHPDKPPAVVWCVQVTTFGDTPLAPGLIVDARLSQAFPRKLVDPLLPELMAQKEHDLLTCRRFGYDGMLWWNNYDGLRERGVTLEQALDRYLDEKMLAQAANGAVPHDTQAMMYFTRTVRRLNASHVKPLIVLMPYHPRVLETFLAVGWGVKKAWLDAYLAGLRKKLDFKVLDCTDSATFGGDPEGFYDGAHLTAESSRRLIRYCVSKAPSCFAPPAKP